MTSESHTSPDIKRVPESWREIMDAPADSTYCRPTENEATCYYLTPNLQREITDSYVHSDPEW